jgi:hypothetical protein
VWQSRLSNAKHSAALHFLALPAGNLTHSQALAAMPIQDSTDNKMTFYLRTTDRILSTLFVFYFIYYCLMGLAFGSGTIVLFTLLGLILMVISLFVKKRSHFISTRLAGLALTSSLVYYDITHGFIQITLDILVYTPVTVFLLFAIWSAVLILRASRN